MKSFKTPLSKSSGKTQYKFFGGPLAKGKFPLSVGRTLTFTIRGVKGHYYTSHDFAKFVQE